MKKAKKLNKKLDEVISQVEEKIIELTPQVEEKLKEKELPTFVIYSEMTDKQMEYYLFGLSSTIYYQAILRLNRLRDAEILNTLASNDPLKEATLMLRSQGERIGIFNLENKVNELIRINKEVNKSKEEKEKDEAETPSYAKW